MIFRMLREVFVERCVLFLIDIPNAELKVR